MPRKRARRKKRRAWPPMPAREHLHLCRLLREFHFHRSFLGPEVAGALLALEIQLDV